MGKSFSVLGNKPYRGKYYMFLAPLFPKKPLEVKMVTPVPSATHNGNGNETKEQDKTESTTALKRDSTSRYRREQARGSFCYKCSWKSLKDLLLPGSSCDEYRCPTIKERFECHQKESHNKKCDCIKHNNPTPTKRRNSRVSIRSGPDYDQYSDQSLPSIKDVVPLTKCRETCQLKSSLVKRNYELEHKMSKSNDIDKNSDGFMTNSDINATKIKTEPNEGMKIENAIPLKYKDTSTMPNDSKSSITDNTNAESAEDKYTNTESPEVSQSKINIDTTSDTKMIKSEKSVDTGTTPDNNDEITKNNVDAYNYNIVERNCSKECTANPDNSHMYRGHCVSFKDCVKHLANKIETPLSNVKRIEFTREALIYERPLYSDIYTSTTTYRDAFTNPHDSNIPSLAKRFNTSRLDENNRNNTCLCASTSCNSNDFDAPASDNFNKHSIQTDSINQCFNNAARRMTDGYTTTYIDDFRNYFEDLNLSTYSGNNQAPTIDENINNVPSSSKNPDYCSCGTSFEHFRQNDNHPSEIQNNSDPYQNAQQGEASTSTYCCEPYSNMYVEKNEISTIQKNNSFNQNALYSYKTVSNSFDDTYGTYSSNCNGAQENCGSVCNSTNKRKFIQKEVEEWILEVPIYYALEKGAQEYFNEIVIDLIKNLSRISKYAENPEYDERVRNEINMYLNRIPIWYPGAKREQEAFKSNIVDRLVQRLNILNGKNVPTFSYPMSIEDSSSFTAFKPNTKLKKDDEMRTCITEWLRLVYLKSDKVIDNIISDLVDLVYKRIKPLMNIPVDTYNHKLILKSAIVDTLNDLPIVTTSPRSDVQTYSFAKKLTDNLLYIQDKYGNHNKQVIAPVIIQSRNNQLNPIEKVDTVVTKEIRKCFEEANIKCNKNFLVEETAFILLDCFNNPDSETICEGKREIIDMLVNSAHISENEAKHITNVLVRKMRKIILKEDVRGVSRRSHIFRHKKRCTVLVCTTAKETGPLSYHLTHLRKRNPRKLYSNERT